MLGDRLDKAQGLGCGSEARYVCFVYGFDLGLVCWQGDGVAAGLCMVGKAIQWQKDAMGLYGILIALGGH